MSKRSNIRQNMGSVSHGTMRAEDLIPCFLSELEGQRPLRRAHVKLAREIRERMESFTPHVHDADCRQTGLDGAESSWSCGLNQDAESYFGTDDADYDLEALFDALNEYCLPYFSFGAHPGDGSDYGYWLSEGFSDDEFDGLKVSDTSEVPRGFTGEVLHVNDHGNCTLYSYSRGRSREVWAVV